MQNFLSFDTSWFNAETKFSYYALEMGLIFSDFENYSKIPPGKISYLIVLVLYTYEHNKTTEKPRVMSFSPWIGCQTHVPSVCLSHGTVTMKKFSVYRASLRSRITAHADEIVNVITLQQPY